MMPGSFHGTRTIGTIGEDCMPWKQATQER
jgi:hypothetical protein